MLMRQRGEVPCEHLEWDSRHFGLRIARVRPTALADDAPAIIDWRRQEAIDCLGYFLRRIGDGNHDTRRGLTLGPAERQPQP